MSVTLSDISVVKSETITDTDVNGGRAGHSQVVANAKQNLFPIVTKAERESGVTRYRKFFYRQGADGFPAPEAYLVNAYCLHPTNGDDRKYLGLGDNRNVQSGMLADPPVWCGAGQLAADLSGGETEVQVAFEADDFEFEPGGELFISSRFLASQTIASGVNPGNSVQYNSGSGEWEMIDYTTDMTHPKGVYLGNDMVMSVHSGTKQERVQLPTGLVSDEVIGTGDGTTTPTISALSDAADGLFTHPAAYRPVITLTSGSTEQTINIAADGTCSGFCTAGKMNMTDGTWDTPITFTSAPDNGTDITANYYKRFWSWTASTATITLDSQVANAFAATNTFVGAVVSGGTVAASYDTFVDASGIYDDTTYPPQVENNGAEDDDWTIEFTSSTAFTCSGVSAGAVGTGNVSEDFAPTNPATGEPYFTLQNEGWEGSPATGNQITFKTYAAVMGIWAKQVVPAGSTVEPANMMMLELSSQ